jgi:hypothetical protein
VTEFFAALIRIANVRNFGLSAICDQAPSTLTRFSIIRG